MSKNELDRKRQCIYCQRKVPMAEFNNPVNMHICSMCVNDIYLLVQETFGMTAMMGVPKSWGR